MRVSAQTPECPVSFYYRDEPTWVFTIIIWPMYAFCVYFHLPFCWVLLSSVDSKKHILLFASIYCKLQKALLVSTVDSKKSQSQFTVEMKKMKIAVYCGWCKLILLSTVDSKKALLLSTVDSKSLQLLLTV